MELGVALPNTHETLAEPGALVRAAQLAERLGFAAAWVNDHVIVARAPVARAGDRQAQYLDRRRESILEPIVLLAHLAAVTDSIRLGTSVYVLALRNAVVAARQVATLDRVSGGRVTLGVGVGWMEGEFDAVGVPFAERGPRTDEGLRVLKELWTSPDPEFHGRWSDFAGVELRPGPLQRPHPPLWIGGRTLVGARRAATLGDAWHPSHFTLEEIRAWAPRLAELCERAGRPRDAVALTSRRRLLPGVPADALPAERRTLQGGAEEIAADLRALADAGVSHMVCELPARSEAELLEAIDWTGREVLPLVRDREVARAGG